MVASLKGSLHGGARRLGRTRRARPSYPNAVRCGPGLTASGVRQTRALVRCGVNLEKTVVARMPTKSTMHEAALVDALGTSDVRLRMYGNPQNRRDGSQQTHANTEIRNRLWV